MANTAAEHAAKCLSDEVDVRNRVNMELPGHELAPSLPVWTEIERCLAPLVIWETDHGRYVSGPSSAAQSFDFPGEVGLPHPAPLGQQKSGNAVNRVKARRSGSPQRTDPDSATSNAPRAKKDGARLVVWGAAGHSLVEQLKESIPRKATDSSAAEAFDHGTFMQRMAHNEFLTGIKIARPVFAH